MVGKLMIISGPSAGVGKDTVIKMFLKKHADWQMLASVTTRKPRAHEINGQDMEFVDKETFETWKNEDKFLEAVLVNDNQWYGTLKQPVIEALNSGKNIILRKDVRGALVIKEKLSEAVLIFITAENFEALEDRIRSRGTEDEDDIQRRLELAKKELQYQAKYDHVIINPTNHPNKAVEELEKIVNN